MKGSTVDNISMQRLWWVGGVVLGASLPHWLAVPFWAPILLVACVVWRLCSRAFGIPLPNRPIRLVLALAAFLGVLLEFRTLNGLRAGSSLLVVMIALKFLESHNQRDQLVLIMISYFLVFAGLLYENQLLSGAYLIFFVWLTTIGLLQLGPYGDAMKNWQMTKFAGRLLLQAAPIMLVLFLLFPRLPGPLWAIPGDTDIGSTGLSETMSPGDITNLGLSEDVAFRVEFQTDAPSPEKLYWRGPVLSKFNGRTWSRREGTWQVAESTLEFFGEPVEYRIMLEPQRQSWAFALDMPQSWSSSRRQSLRMQSDYQLRAFLRNPTDGRFDYEVVSYTEFAARERLDDQHRQHYLAMPDGFNPRTIEMIATWKAEGLDDERIIERALDVFRGDDYFYTLTPPPLGQHSIDDFIFGTKEGFCEHYASAYAFMMRAAGIPARVVTGYQGGELNSFGSYYFVRQSNAHAWTEVWLDDRGWVRVDPISAVAPERIALGSSQSALSGSGAAGSALTRMSWIRQIAYAWDAMNIYWDDWVVGYGPQLQRSLLEKLGFERPGWRHMIAIAAGAIVVLSALLAAYLRWIARKHTRADAAERQFRRFIKRLAQARVPPRAPAESAAAFGARAVTRVPASTRQIERIVTAYLRARYEPDEKGRRFAYLERLVTQFKPPRRARVWTETRRPATAPDSN